MDPGTILGDRYRLDRPLGSGDLGTVWEGTDTVLGRPVAIKVAGAALADDPEAAEVVRRQTTAAAALTHRNTVTIFDAGTVSGRPYIVMALVDGAPLDVLAADGSLPAGVVAVVGRDVARGLQAVHDRDLVHGDVKPANVLVSSGGEACVTDIGITGTGEPEGDDLPALGRMLHDLAAGPGATTGAGDPLPPGLAAVLAAARQPDGGFATAGSLAAALEELIGAGDRDRLARMVRAAEVPPPDAEPSTVTRAMPQPGNVSPDVSQPEQDAQPTTVIDRPREPAADPAPEPTPAPGDEQPASTSAADPGPGWTRPRRDVIAGVLTVIALVVVAAALQGLLGDDDGRPDGGRTTQAGPTTPSTPLTVVSATDFDPFSEGQAEHPEDVGRAVDGDPATAWSTEQYRVELQQLKPGVGLWVELSRSATPGAVEIELPLEGVDLEVYVADRPPTGTDPAAWGRQIGAVTDAGGVVTVEPTDAAGRFVLVWLTGLASADGGLEAHIAEVRVRE